MKILWIKNSKVVNVVYSDNGVHASDRDGVDEYTTDPTDSFNIGDDWTIDIAIEKSEKIEPQMDSLKELDDI
jgi:hypothetical protein